jgi:hypothetical protein
LIAGFDLYFANFSGHGCSYFGHRINLLLFFSACQGDIAP